MNQRFLLLKGLGQIVTCDSDSQGDPGLIESGSILIEGEKIRAIGSEAELLEGIAPEEVAVLDCSGLVAAPGYVDCHTHLVFGGSRLDEYIQNVAVGRPDSRNDKTRIGIGVSIEATRSETLEGLVASSLDKLRRMHRHGTTTVEIKSGYGIDLETELRQLKTVSELKKLQPMDLYATYLGGHYWDTAMGKEAYLDFMTEQVMPRIADEKLADFCDIWVDEGYYTAEEAERYLQAGARFGMKGKMHTECYSAIGGAEVCAKLKTVSADHLNFTDDEAIARMAEAGVIGVILPGTDFSVKHPRPADPVRHMEGGMDIALATNLNPGNWIESMHIIMALACRNHRMTPAEALVGATRNGARALGLSDRGVLKEGFLADIQLWETDRFENAVYKFGSNPVVGVIKRGKPTIWERGGEDGL